MKLCRKCTEEWDHVGSAPWLHCHHEEEPECIVCKDGTDTKELLYSKGSWGIHKWPNFCPNCGRKLE
jgi:hypothetical protein